jgi:hypothetical protein
MNAPQTGKNAAADNELGTSSDIFVQVKGRVKGFERLKSQTSGKEYVRTLITKPAKDAYSHPSTFCVFSSFQIAAADADVDVKCELRPSFRKGTDGKSFHNVNLWRAEQ